MPKPRARKRGVRKFFSRPKKGYRTYGSNKCWQDVKDYHTLLATHPSNLLDSEYIRVPKEMHEDGFKGFETLPPSVSVPSSYAPLHLQSEKRSIRVLSLFDGISSAYYILHAMLGLQVEKYWSSEIDPQAIKVQQHNFGCNVIAVGCVQQLQKEDLDNLGRVDLLVGGSPCSDLSLVNWRRKGLNDKHGSGILFFDFVRVLHILLEKNEKKGIPLYWIFENTAAMESTTLHEMSRHLGCPPVVRCAQEFVPMVRKRNYWGNIEGMYDSSPRHVSDLRLQNFLMPHRTAAVDCVPTLTSSISSQRCGYEKNPPLIYEGKEEFLSVSEMEILFGFRAHYTDCDNLSPSCRRKLLGKSWCTPVVADILKPLSNIFKIQAGNQRCSKHSFVTCFDPRCLNPSV